MGNASSGSRGIPASAASATSASASEVVREEDRNTTAVTSASNQKHSQGGTAIATVRAQATAAEHAASAATKEATDTATATLAREPSREPTGRDPAAEEWEAYLRRRLPRLSKQELSQWGQVTTAGIIAGNIFGGTREAMATHAEYLHQFRETQTRVTQRELMERRLVRIVGGTVRGGVQLGLLAGIFSGTQILTAVTLRGGVQDWWTTSAAGGVAGGAMGLVGRGAPSIRLQRSLTFACAGALIAIPLGLLQDSLRSLLPEDDLEQVPLPRPLPSEEIAAAIERLESRMLGNSGTEDQEKSG